MLKADKIADFFLKRYSADGNITPMKLIKLVYIAHGWCLGFTGNPLIDENPEAWKYGPVIPSIYQKYKHYNGGDIKVETDADFSTGIGNVDVFLERIWNQYGKFNGTALSNRTHQPGTPWSITWNDLKNQNRKSLQIPENCIRDHYQLLINSRREQG